MQKRHKRIAMIIAVFLVAVLVLSILIPALITDASVTQKDINDKKKELESITADKLKTQALRKDMENKKADVAQLKALYDEQIALIDREIELTTELIAQLNVAIGQNLQELQEMREREAELAALYLVRLQAMEDMGDLSYLSILLRAQSLTEFLSQWDAMQEIIKLDQDLAAELIGEREKIEETIISMEEDRREVETRRQELFDQQAEQAVLAAEAQALMTSYAAEVAKHQTDEKKLAEAEAATRKEIEDMAKEWARIQEELRKRNNKYVGGEYMWPVPGHTTVSSPFGDRIHPVYKVKRKHTGIDIPAPKGTNIVAANAGEIIIRKKASGYGNYIVIDHGGGQASLYAHMNAFNSKYTVGSNVKAGDVIGYVGTTGVSTGNHLHFEISINGEHVDPEPYLKGK
ncbi:MAG: peptidoglycan DD-metalloendopeptidase family protein [Oscillospiraceae bacterium]|nr:peptidoglycan DD-metalloendopeptidase family protein [Oscillospiraceae bacterium]